MDLDKIRELLLSDEACEKCGEPKRLVMKDALHCRSCLLKDPKAVAELVAWVDAERQKMEAQREALIQSILNPKILN